MDFLNWDPNYVAQMVKHLLTMRENPWRRKWQPTPVLLPGKSLGWRNLAGYTVHGVAESDTTEQCHFHFLAV